MDTLPRDIGQYRLEQKIGQGGMGVVYRATDVVLDRPVAVKMILLSDELSDEERDVATRRFQREAKSAARIQSRHVAQVLNFGKTEAGELYIAMELLDGVSLSKLLATEKRLSPTRTVRIARQVCRGLQAAHDLGIVHRDLKAANIMIVKADGIDEFAKLLDFGVAKVSKETDRGTTTQQGSVVGTLNVMAPEQLEGEAVDARADIYAMGVLLYRMLTGTPVFEANDVAALIRHQLKTKPQSLRERCPDAKIPEALDKLVLRCLEKKPGDRPESMKALEKQLAAVGLPPEVTDPGGLIGRSSSVVDLETQPTNTNRNNDVTTLVTAVRIEHRKRRTAMFAAAGAAAALGLVSAVFVLTSSEEPAPPPTAPPTATTTAATTTTTAGEARAEPAPPPAPPPPSPAPARVVVDEAAESSLTPSHAIIVEQIAKSLEKACPRVACARELIAQKSALTEAGFEPFLAKAKRCRATCAEAAKPAGPATTTSAPAPPPPPDDEVGFKRVRTK